MSNDKKEVIFLTPLNIHILYMVRLILFLSIIFLPSAMLAQTQKQQSLLSSGEWFNIKIDTTGVYKLTYNDLVELGISNPQNTRIFTHSGQQLSFYCSSNTPDDLTEIPLHFEKGSDGIFGKDDYLYFYAQGVTTLRYDSTLKLFTHAIHDYSPVMNLFVTSLAGAEKSISQAVQTPNTATTIVDSYNFYGYVDNDRINLVKSGRRWFDSKILPNNRDSVAVVVPNILTNEKVTVQAFAACRKSVQTNNTYLTYRYQGKSMATIRVSKSYNDHDFAHYDSCKFSFLPKNSKLYIAYSFYSPSSQSECYTDKVCVNARAKLVFTGKQLHFRDLRSIDDDIVRFNIASNAKAKILDVTNPLEPIFVNAGFENNVLYFSTQPQGKLREFVVFDENNLRRPIIPAKDQQAVANQNIHGMPTPDMLIVTHPNFMKQAEELAQWHQQQDGFTVNITTPQAIYNEFSGGTPDATAIRNCARMFYQRSKKFKYLLLFGDGTYDNRNILKSSSNYIPTFESLQGESHTHSFTSDDFFGMLKDGDGELWGTLDIAVGRLPANTAAEAQIMVDKIKYYATNSSYGNWRNTIALLADDEDNGNYVKYSEIIDKTLKEHAPEITTKKIYLDSYKQISSATGASYPEATKALHNYFAQGAVAMLYSGHGSPQKIAHESLFQISDVNALRNIDKLTFMVTASCEVGRFDDHQKTSFGESLIKNPSGGAIAGLFTSRVVYSSQNQSLANKLFAYIGESSMRIGDMIRQAKNDLPISDINKRCFILMGDPAIRLHHPANKNAFVTSINGKPVLSALSDTIRAIDTVKIEGYVCDINGDLIDANGVLYPTIYDKPNFSKTLGNDPTSDIIEFEDVNSVLYQGKVSITNGFYSFSFIMPKEINYSYGKGKISLYAVVDNEEIVGCSNNIIIGGTPSDATITDYEGPRIELFANDTNFINGGVVGNNPIFIARLFDESGINTTGNGIGHNITATLDNDPSTTIILNSNYENHIDSYKSGEIRFMFPNLENGKHTITFKAWDIYNNPSEYDLNVEVKNSSMVTIGNVYNYPNPVTDYTQFVVNHNQTDTDVEIKITITDIAGHPIERLRKVQKIGESASVYWKPQSGNKKIENGIYLYTIEISNSVGSNKKSGRMIISQQ